MNCLSPCQERKEHYTEKSHQDKIKEESLRYVPCSTPIASHLDIPELTRCKGLVLWHIWWGKKVEVQSET